MTEQEAKCEHKFHLGSWVDEEKWVDGDTQVYTGRCFVYFICEHCGYLKEIIKKKIDEKIDRGEE